MMERGFYVGVVLWRVVLVAILMTAAHAKAQVPEAYVSLPPADSSLNLGDQVAAPGGGLGDYNANWYVLQELNEGLPPLPDTLFQLSPQETLEGYVRACRAGKFATAAQALNLNLFPTERQAELGELLAQQLYYVIDQRLGLAWGSIPDRPDGAATKPRPGAGTIGAASRSVEVGSLISDGRPIALRLQRVRVGDEPPRWVWAATTVEEIPRLYKGYGPGYLEQHVPTWSKQRLLGVQLWVLAGIILSFFLCWLLGWLVFRGMRWLCKTVPFKWANVLGDKLAKPVGIAAGIIAFYFILQNVLSLSGPWARGFYILLLVVVVFTVVWVASRAVDYVISFYADTQLADITDESNDESRRLLTMLSVGRRVIVFILLVLGMSIIFSRISGLESIGYALMGSAGFAAIVLGIAAQSTLGNLVAGVQIAITKPVRIGDVVLYEGNWGNVEDVRFTYLVIRTWDLRRVVVPLKYFIDNPFENWSMTDSKLLKTFFVYADYRIDVDKVREKFTALVREHELFNGHKEPDFIVYAIEKDCLKLRGTVSAEDSSKAWTLHCDVREAINAYITQLEEGLYLPRERVRVLDAE